MPDKKVLDKKLLDDSQLVLLSLFTKLANRFNNRSFFSNLIGKFGRKKACQGIYLYGDVGRGKTMLMKMFYSQLFKHKKLIHFQHFMQSVHQDIHKFQTKNLDTDKILQQIASHIASTAQVLCIDEFEIKDITDAMLIMKLFAYLGKNNVFIFVTTNTKPDNLYKDGLQRESFLPFIDMVKRDFTVLNLDGDHDYRLSKAASAERRILFPINKETKADLAEIKEDLCQESELRSGNIKVFGRETIFCKTHKNILFTNFEELFTRELGYADYVAICRQFKIIVLEDVRRIMEDETDLATRLINFIDNAYFYKVLLFALLETEPALLYTSGKRVQEYKRAVSRLRQMSALIFTNDFHEKL